MKIISTNNIGNYGPGYVKSVRQKPNVGETQQTAMPKNEKITNEEKNFFVNLYPESRKEIADYHFYQKSGKMSGVSVGSLFDKRG
ncbi:MAG: hypothetical protein ACM3S2_08300 [Ignavibacteriales bacterium]